MKIALIGHRSERLRGKKSEVANWIIERITALRVGQDEIICYCGCTEGADEIFGRMCSAFLDVKLVLCKPCKGYRLESIDWLDDIANEEICMCDFWNNAADDLRDRYMVEHCDILLAVWDGIKVGGVWSTIQYAKKLGKPIIYFPKEIFFEDAEEAE